MRWVLLPGFDGTGLLYAPFLEVLPPEIEPVVLRYPVDRICSASELLGIVLSRLPESEPYVLIAESFSGPLALRASVMHSNPPIALVLCASFANCPVPRVAIKILRMCVSQSALHRPPKWLVRHFLIGNAREELLALFYGVIAAVSPHVLAHRLTVLLEFKRDYIPAFPKSPLLYLQASQDHLVGAHNCRILQRQYSNLKIERIESPHLILQVQPNASAQAIMDFLSDISLGNM